MTGYTARPFQYMKDTAQSKLTFTYMQAIHLHIMILVAVMTDPSIYLARTVNTIHNSVHTNKNNRDATKTLTAHQQATLDITSRTSLLTC